MSKPIDKAWKTRRAQNRAKVQKEKRTKGKLSIVARKEIAGRKIVQAKVAPYLAKWWVRELLEGTRSKTKPIKCEVCGESEPLGLAIHHIDPKIERGNKNYEDFNNKAPLCGTCHNIITYKKTRNPSEVVRALKLRHKRAAITKGSVETKAQCARKYRNA